MSIPTSKLAASLQPPDHLEAMKEEIAFLKQGGVMHGEEESVLHDGL